MEYLLEETVPAADLKKFEDNYNEEIRLHGKPRVQRQSAQANIHLSIA